MYKQVFIPGHAKADVTGLVPEHIVIAEEELGRPLERGELVHHKDFNKFNNSGDNLLFPLSRIEHQQLPAFQARFILSKGLYEEFLEWWKQAKVADEANSGVHELEKKLVQARNEKQRLLCRQEKAK